jgi:peptide/nickel transport system substrate-binding protein
MPRHLKRVHLRQLATLAAALLIAEASPAERLLRIGVIGTIAGTHPDIPNGGSPYLVSGLAARSLTYFDSDVRMACLLCTELPTVENGGVFEDMDPEGRPGQKVVFQLTPGLRWDDGTPLTAQDFVEAWQVGRRPENGYAWRSRLSDEIWSVSAPDDRTLEIRRRGRSCVPSDFRFMPIPRHLEGAWSADDPSSYRANSLYLRAPTTPGLYNGPYRVTRYEASAEDQHILLERNPHWRGGDPGFDRIEIVYRPTMDAMASAISERRIDLLMNAPMELADLAERQYPQHYYVLRRPGRTLMQVSLNHDDPRLADPRVRRALLLALNRARLARSFSPQAVPATSFLTHRFPWFEPSLGGPAGGRLEAMRLLDEAGWPPGPDGLRGKGPGQTLTFRLAIQRARFDDEFVADLVGAWRDVGIGISVEPWGGIAQLTGNDPPPLALFGYTLEGGVNIDFHVFDSHSVPLDGEVRNGLNIFRYRSDDTDRIIARLRDACDPGELEEAYRNLQVRIAQDLPLLPLFFLPEAHLLPHGLLPSDTGRAQLLLPQEIELWEAASVAGEPGLGQPMGNF